MSVSRATRSAGPSVLTESPAGPSTSAQVVPPKTTGVQTRQRRIMPSRSRRGGPGVGTGDVDVMILETLKRRHESEPLIPANTRFLLTTNSSLTPASSSGVPFELELNTSAYDRYFDKPEVLKAYREQQIIQTPEYSRLAEHATVGGRFRPRGSEDEGTDTSDAAYEKRHRKYETFEKRQRLREKEKLKHEHYKLKERIDQLRSMDASAFLAVSDSAFSDHPKQEHPDDANDALGHSAEDQAVAVQEGERRKKQMLDVAFSLEERYRTLLNPDHNKTQQSSVSSRQQSVATPQDPPAPSASEDEEDVEAKSEPVEEPVPVKPEPQKLKFRIKFTPRAIASTSASAPPKASHHLTRKSSTISSPSTRAPLVLRSKTQVSSPLASGAAGASPPASSASAPGRATASPVATRASTRVRGAAANGDAPSPSGSTPDFRARKRLKGHDSAHAIDIDAASPEPSVDEDDASSSSEDDYPHGDYRKSALYVAALRSASAPTARHTQRHVTAFGVKLPQETLESFRDFYIPGWAWPRNHPSFEDEIHYEEGSSATYAKSDAAVEDILDVKDPL
ncbi:hypothetical protein BV25DRAFT_1908738 [Artomyces pyxidatus]|uniref:Uncharacterized protein n=1 Tax=Artomyces pyxidatus TaxID=48021 RepID=A0ACB8SSS5_9AGAM|nr:hypothetical protein BV25DRAFT_1908738 [Artomyces pyxidatus]